MKKNKKEKLARKMRAAKTLPPPHELRLEGNFSALLRKNSLTGEWKTRAALNRMGQQPKIIRLLTLVITRLPNDHFGYKFRTKHLHIPPPFWQILL